MERLTKKYVDGQAYVSLNHLSRMGENECVGLPITKLARYEDAEEQGLLLRLLCKVEDKVWAITSTANYSLGEYREVPLKHPQEKKIQSITVTKYGLLYHVKDRTYSEQDFGKTVFLTKEEAEQALAERKNDE